MNDESTDTIAFNGSYTGSNYGVSITYASVEDGVGVTNNMGAEKEDTYTAFNAYYTPDQGGLPSISVGYEVGEDGSAASTADEITSFFVGLQWDEVGPGSLGLAAGHSSTPGNMDEDYMYEVYYSYPVNDGMTITPVVYTKTGPSYTDAESAFLVKSAFSF